MDINTEFGQESQILRSSAVIVFTLMLLTAGTLAFFGVIGLGNDFTVYAQSSELLELMDDDEDWSSDDVNASFYVVDWAPGGTYQGWISFKNSGPENIENLLMTWSVTNHGGSTTEPEREADPTNEKNDLSTQIIITRVQYGPVDNLEDILENIKDNLGIESPNPLTVDNLDNKTIDLEAMLPESKSGIGPDNIDNLIIDFLFNPSAGNEYQTDYLTADIEFQPVSETG